MSAGGKWEEMSLEMRRSRPEQDWVLCGYFLWVLNSPKIKSQLRVE